MAEANVVGLPRPRGTGEADVVVFPAARIALVDEHRGRRLIGNGHARAAAPDR